MILHPFSHLRTGCTACLFRAVRLHKCLSHKLRAIPDSVEVYPAHLAGSACGAGTSGKSVTAIAFEERRKPVLGLGRKDFNQGRAS